MATRLKEATAAARPVEAGLTSREAGRRLEHFGPNELEREQGPSLLHDVAVQFVQPLALLLEVAAVLAYFSESAAIAAAIAAVIVLNALLAVWQERQAEHAIEALRDFLPAHATVVRDAVRRVIPADQLVPGDVLLISEGERVSADARLIQGSLEVDMSTLTGESVPVVREAGHDSAGFPPLETADRVFSGTVALGGDAQAVVTETGMRTQLGRVAALSQRSKNDSSPLQQQVSRVAWLLALIAVVAAVAFLPLGIVFGGLSLHAAALFAIGLLVANVPEGLLPTITLALAIGVRRLARRRALVKRLSAVETLGSTTVICTDKTGTLTQNRMTVTDLWTPPDGDLDTLLRALAACNNAELGENADDDSGDPTELALLRVAADHGIPTSRPAREEQRVAEFRFDPALKRMATIDHTSAGVVANLKGAPDVLLARSSFVLRDGATVPLDGAQKALIGEAIDDYARRGLRLIGAAQRALPDGFDDTTNRNDIERELTFVGLAALSDPARPEVADAVRLCHEAGIRIHVVTGDHGRTALAIAQAVGIGVPAARIVEGPELDAMEDDDLDHLLSGDEEIVFARSAPETKVRVADALLALGHTVAMTGDGVNDAPALRRADIGVAMGRSGTDVAREAATMVLTDDNFATIVAAIEEGRRVYANIRKFILYIFAHLTPEVVPFLVFALSGGAIPLPLTALQILAIDLGTETLPALALGSEAAEPGIMRRAPRPRSEGVLTGALFRRAWLFLGLISAALVVAGFLYVLLEGGWRPGDAVGAGSPHHHAYLQATTMTFLGIVACQLGTGFAARTDRVSLREIGVFSNRLLIAGMVFEIAFAAALIYVPFLQDIFSTTALGWDAVLFVLPFPFIVWGADELRRLFVRRRARYGPPAPVMQS